MIFWAKKKKNRMERPLIIEVVIGYMLKVWKAQKKIIKYKVKTIKINSMKLRD